MATILVVSREPASRSAAVESIRRFNRFYTRTIGVLQEGLLDSGFSLAEARIVFELAQSPDVEVGSLRRELGLDPGYLSRLLSGLEEADMLTRRSSPQDGRRQVARLTAKGRRAFAKLDAAADAQVEQLIAHLAPGEREELAATLSRVASRLSAQKHPDERRAAGLVLRPLRAGDLGWILRRHALLYVEEYGWGAHFEAAVADIISEYLGARGDARQAGWIAELGGHPVGSVLCMKENAEVARLRLLLVEPEARGNGIGGRLVDECIAFARGNGYKKIVLSTQNVLLPARHIYERRGFRLESTSTEASYDPTGVSESWSLDL